MPKDTKNFDRLKEIIDKEKRVLKELVSSTNHLKKANPSERSMLIGHIKNLNISLTNLNNAIPSELDKIDLVKKLPEEKGPMDEKVKLSDKKLAKMDELKKKAYKQQKPVSKEKGMQKNLGKEEGIKDLSNVGYAIKPQENDNQPLPRRAPLKKTFVETLGFEKIYKDKELKPDALEKETIKRMKKSQSVVVVKKEEKANPFVRKANEIFSSMASKMISQNAFPGLEDDLIKANMRFTPRGYISVVLYSTLVALVIGVTLAIFFFIFKITPDFPFINFADASVGTRLLRVFWMPILFPILTLLIMLAYPSMEKTSAEKKINDELPFAAIHMSAISGSMIDPSKIFSIIISTKEYPALEKEFIKLINEINIYGYDFVSALKTSAKRSPSKKLSELFTGLSTTINSGGDLPGFFDKRAETLLFDHSLQKEKQTKANETFMDMYISLVIAAPMILMILLMMMKMSGLGVALSSNMITIIMVMAVTIINIIFLTFLQFRK